MLTRWLHKAEFVSTVPAVLNSGLPLEPSVVWVPIHHNGLDRAAARALVTAFQAFLAGSAPDWRIHDFRRLNANYLDVKCLHGQVQAVD